ncbi:uncharacterized protein BDW47DRAFT_108026 [Aspergillus candidus]|uniref:Wax synthase domain-containing protein n=1 Tax=Aspergillus candidus TaxID=41067 RepID=A0A2I2F7Z5_ASPCN|nr:hypothetical protein BDW47DRAFT_108026 [Aspergillus candidus]PLB36741.1 hypothetical protein BDW47DRAFT_108026 [Aspergillus candidus]
MLLLFLPLPLLLTTLYLRSRYPLVQLVLLPAIILGTLHALLYPPEAQAWVQYANGFLSVGYLVRAVELLLVRDVEQLRALDRTSRSSAYSWQPMPAALGWTRLRWMLDLVMNPRAIGWSHGSARYHHPERLRNRRLPFFCSRLLTLVTAYLVFDAHQTCFSRNYPRVCSTIATILDTTWGVENAPEISENIAITYLFPVSCWLAVFSFMEAVRTLYSMVTVAILGTFSDLPSGEPWMYPGWFGSVTSLFRLNLKGIWGKMWHDLCRRPLLAISVTMTPRRWPGALKTFFIFYLSFIISGTFHAAGAYATLQSAHSAAMMMAFFNVLPVFIALQQLLSEYLIPQLLPRGLLADGVAWSTDAVIMAVWTHWTCPWFTKYSAVPEIIASFPLPVSFWGWLGGYM